ncbi:MAG: O-methyltransferase [Tissierellia bacterium]|nr:O-methyltransferase [Tissierellia bacterium]
MNEINNEKIVDFINNIYIKNKVSEELEDLRIYGQDHNIPIIHREVAEFIKSILVLKKPKKILEIGTAIGYSSIFFANYALDAQITTIEINEEMCKIARENIKKFGFEDRITLLEGDALDLIGSLEDKFDFVFIDAAKGQYIKFFELIEEKLDDKAVIISDNILFRGMVGDDDLVKRRKITIVKRLRKYLDMLVANENYTSSILQIGDGLALTIKEAK